MGVLALAILSVGYLFAFRVERAIAFQERYAEAISWKTPSEDPAYYEETREHRWKVFQLGGGVLLSVGTLLFTVSMYATFFVESFPQ